MARNHIGKCTCPKGIYKGDPYNSGCQKVNCIENDDCPANEYCDRLSYTCRSVNVKQSYQLTNQVINYNSPSLDMLLHL